LGRSAGAGIGYPLQYSWASLVAQPAKNPPAMWTHRTHKITRGTILTPPRGFPCGSAVKNPPAMQKTWVLSLGREDPLEKEIQSTPVFLPGKPHGQRSLVGFSA